MNYWYNSANFYHIYAFGLGKEVEKWIPHIKEMGCNVILFSPIFKSRTHGYDTTDYYQIDDRIGNNESFKKLVETLHENNIRVVLDGVFNHCGRDFFAFKDVCEKGRASEYCNWFSGITFDKKSPLGDDFSYDTWNGYFELVKFNLQNLAVKKYLLDAVKHWVEYFDIDGLRLDAADVLDFDFMSELRQATTSLKPDFWLMGEVVHGNYAKWVNDDTLHSVTNYVLYKGLYSSHNDKNLFELAHTLTNQFGAGGSCKNLQLYNFADNHDQSRLASKVSNPAYLYTIYILLYTMPGIPSLYYGSEWGIKGEKTSTSDIAVRPYINIDDIVESTPNLTNTIKKLSVIRNNSKALQVGDYKQIFIEYQKPYAFERTLGDERIIVVVNPFDSSADICLSQYGSQFFDVLNNENINGGNAVIHSHWGRILIAQ